MTKIMIDAGHGGADPGAVYNGRQEKDDNLNLALAVGRILEEDGYEVEYTRTKDLYQTPYEKAELGNGSGADLFVSIHRNSSVFPDQYSGVETLVFDNSGQKARRRPTSMSGWSSWAFATSASLSVPIWWCSTVRTSRRFWWRPDSSTTVRTIGCLTSSLTPLPGHRQRHRGRLSGSEAGGLLPGADRHVQKSG